MKPFVWRTLGTTIAVAALGVAFVHAQPAFTKAQVGDRIRKVEDGVDEFRKYLERRGDEAHERKDTAQKDSAQKDNTQKSGKSGRRGAGTRPRRRRAPTRRSTRKTSSMTRSAS